MELEIRDGEILETFTVYYLYLLKFELTKTNKNLMLFCFYIVFRKKHALLHIVWMNLTNIICKRSQTHLKK